jgi:beta-lactamase class D
MQTNIPIARAVRALSKCLLPAIMLALTGFFQSTAQTTAQTNTVDSTLGRLFKMRDGKPLEGAFVVYDMKNDAFTRYNAPRCKQRFSPFSTFKIPNSLIGLETGAIPDTSTVINWDRKKYPPQEHWSRDFPDWMDNQTMRTALRNSVVWYYRELARRVGERDLKRYVDLFNYGNKDISGGIYAKNTMEAFWLGSSLLISADEQVEFLLAFYTRQLPVSVMYVTMIKDMLTLEETLRYRLCAKTGGGLDKRTGKYLGWYVGFIETTSLAGDKNVYFFALNVDAATFGIVRDRRESIAKQILRELEILPSQ